MTTHQHLLAQLLPPVSYDTQAIHIRAELFAEGTCLDKSMLAANSVSDGIAPYRSGQLISDWERVLGLVNEQKSYQERVNAVLFKIAETGGLSIPYFISLGEQLGYKLSIVEHTPFYADIHGVGDAVYINEAMYIWQVLIKGVNSCTTLFRASASAANERLMSFGDPIIETVFNNLKPAHTFVYFAYEET